MKLSVVVPCYNEAATLRRVLDAVVAAPVQEVEIVVVDDGSTDGSLAIAHAFSAEHPATVIALGRNCGKGAAVRAGYAAATGDAVLVQDADLEYDPAEYPRLLAPLADPAVQVVYGSRILGSRERSYDRYYWGGRLITAATNLLFGSRLTDEPTCYKLVRRPLLESLDLTSTGFEFCPELTGKLLRRGVEIVEVPISYRPRSFEEGKKIRWSDGLVAVRVLLRERLRRAPADATEPAPTP